MCRVLILLLVVGYASSLSVLQVAQSLQANTFVSLVHKAGLTNSLNTQGPFTTFIPTDKAFSKLPQDVLVKLSNDADLLVQVLKYHISSGRHLTASFQNDQEIPSWSSPYKIRINSYQNGKVMTAAGKTILRRDIMATNGVVNLINDVLYPLPEENILQYCAENKNLTQLVYSLVRSNLQYDITGGPFTVFAPIEAAFDALPTGYLNTEFLTLDKSRNLMQYHYAKGTYYSAGLINGENIRTVQGTEVTIHIRNDKVMVENATVLHADITVSNGVIHIIDKVMIPAQHGKDMTGGESSIG